MCLGTHYAEDELVYEEKDERFNIGAGRTRDDKYIILECSSHTTTEEQFLRADDPRGTWRLIAPRREEIEYYADHRNGQLYIRTNDTGRNFRLVTAPVETPGVEHWTEADPSARRRRCWRKWSCSPAHAVVWERREGLQHILVRPFAGAGAEMGAGRRLVSRSRSTACIHMRTGCMRRSKYRYAYQSLVTPASVFEYDVATGESKLLKQLEVPGGFDRERYASERIFAQAPDGVEVPVSLVWRKDKREAGTESAMGLWVRSVWVLAAGRVQQQSAEPAGSRLRAGVCARARRRRSGQGVARCRAADAEAEHVHGFHCGDGASGGARMGRAGSGGGRGWQRGRIADGCGGEPAAGSVSSDDCARAVRRCDEHDAGSHAAADRAGVRGVGRSEPERGVRVHAELFALRQS